MLTITLPIFFFSSDSENKDLVEIDTIVGEAESFPRYKWVCQEFCVNSKAEFERVY